MWANISLFFIHFKFDDIKKMNQYIIMKYYYVEIKIGKECAYVQNNITWFRLQFIKLACKWMPMHVNLKYAETNKADKSLAFANYKI
jgi:hypothetical protein